MPKLRQSQIVRFLIVLGLAAGSFGGKCSDVPPEGATLACGAGVAEMAMWDGRLERMCGCGGIENEFSTPNVNMDCTIALGTTVFVYYQGPFLQHQFVSVGTPTLPTGPVYAPSAKSPIRAHAFTPGAVGVYSFEDEYDHSMIGTITVTP
jgi:hypothetical protein